MDLLLILRTARETGLPFIPSSKSNNNFGLKKQLEILEKHKKLFHNFLKIIPY